MSSSSLLCLFLLSSLAVSQSISNVLFRKAAVSAAASAALLCGSPIASMISVPLPAAAVEIASSSAGTVYSDSRYKFDLKYPARFVSYDGQLSSDRNIVAFVDPNDKDASVSIVVTAIPADFTKLNSFGGGKDTLRQYLLPTGEGIETVLIDEAIKGENYYLEYTTKSADANRHVYSIFALRPAEAVVGVTVQCSEASFATYKNSLFDTVKQSFHIDL